MRSINRPYDIDPPPIFIIGNPRSGTTLLRLILNSHSKIAVPPECGFAAWLYPKYKNWQFSDKEVSDFSSDLNRSKKFETWGLDINEIKSFILNRQPTSYDILIDSVYKFYIKKKYNDRKNRWGDKNNFYLNHIEDIYNIFPNSKFLVIIRDGRDVACSYKEVNKKNISSIYAPVFPDSIHEIANLWMNNYKKIQNSFERLSIDRVFYLKYEDLVSKPVQILSEICSFIGEKYEMEMTEFFINGGGNEPDEFLQWKNNIQNPISIKSVGRYKRELTDSEIKTFNSISNNLLDKFNYYL